MSANTKKQSLSFYLNAVTCVLGIAGLVTLIISSTMSSANALHGLPLLAVLAVGGIVLIALAMYMSSRNGLAVYISFASVVAAIALFTTVVGNTISSRILLISGLFSFNSGNMVGWNVFYVTVASIVCFLVSVLLLIVGSFMKSGSK